MPGSRKGIFGRLRQDEFGRHVLHLFTGAALAQAVLVVTAPALARLFTPAVYGAFALFQAISTILALVATGRYEMTIPLPERDEDAANLVALSLAVGAVVSMLVLALTLAGAPWIAGALGNPGLAPWLHLVPLYTLLRSVQSGLAEWAKRKRRFQLVAASQAANAIVMAGASLALGAAGLGVAGLVGGLLLGQASATALLAVRTRPDARALRGCVSGAHMRRVGLRYVRFPQVSVVSGLVESAALQLPQILLSSYFGAVALGSLSMALRVCSLPVDLLAGAAGEVFRQAASRDYARSASCRPLLVRTAGALALVALPCGGVLLAGPELFALVFGESWRTAGEYARVLAPMLALKMLSSPLSSVFYIAEKLSWDLAIQATLLLGLVGSVKAVSVLGAGAAAAVAALSALYSLKYVVELVLSYRFSQGQPRPNR